MFSYHKNPLPNSKRYEDPRAQLGAAYMRALERVEDSWSEQMQGFSLLPDGTIDPVEMTKFVDKLMEIQIVPYPESADGEMATLIWTVWENKLVMALIPGMTTWERSDSDDTYMPTRVLTRPVSTRLKETLESMRRELEKENGIHD